MGLQSQKCWSRRPKRAWKKIMQHFPLFLLGKFKGKLARAWCLRISWDKGDFNRENVGPEGPKQAWKTCFCCTKTFPLIFAWKFGDKLAQAWCLRVSWDKWDPNRKNVCPGSPKRPETKFCKLMHNWQFRGRDFCRQVASSSKNWRGATPRLRFVDLSLVMHELHEVKNWSQSRGHGF
jgi:hypothetical protein